MSSCVQVAGKGGDWGLQGSVVRSNNAEAAAAGHLNGSVLGDVRGEKGLPQYLGGKTHRTWVRMR